MLLPWVTLQIDPNTEVDKLLQKDPEELPRQMPSKICPWFPAGSWLAKNLRSQLA